MAARTAARVYTGAAPTASTSRGRIEREELEDEVVRRTRAQGGIIQAAPSVPVRRCDRAERVEGRALGSIRLAERCLADFAQRVGSDAPALLAQPQVLVGTGHQAFVFFRHASIPAQAGARGCELRHDRPI